MKTPRVRSNEEWKYWGDTDPLFGVLSDPRKSKGSPTPWKDTEFFQVGEEHWAALWPQWRSYGVTTDSCLEIGCGVGRMTRQLARVFKKVHALDVSEGMIRTAQAKSSLPNVEYLLTCGLDIPLTASSVTAAFSMHVLQHLDSTDLQIQYLRNVYTALKPGGTMLVHLPLYKFPFSGAKLQWLYGLLCYKQRLINRFKRTLIRRGLKLNLMEFTEMSTEEVFRQLSGMGFQQVEIRLVATHGNTQIHPLILGRKA